MPATLILTDGNKIVAADLTLAQANAVFNGALSKAHAWKVVTDRGELLINPQHVIRVY